MDTEKFIVYLRFGYVCFLALLIGASMALCSKARADEIKPEPYRIAIIDTGMSYIPFDTTYFKLCKDGHYDFSQKTATVGEDTIGHGSFVAALVNQRANTDNICFLVYKVFPATDREVVTKAMIKAYRAGAKAMNLSLSIGMYSRHLERVTKALTKRGVKLFVSSGNDGENLNKRCMIYPQCIKGAGPNLKLVGATNRFYEPTKYSNYGMRLHVWHWGTIGDARGTSFASPRALGDYIRSLNLDE